MGQNTPRASTASSSAADWVWLHVLTDRLLHLNSALVKVTTANASTLIDYSVDRLCRGFVCSCCVRRAAIFACDNLRCSNVMGDIREAKMLQPMTEFGWITWRGTCVDNCVTRRLRVTQLCLRSNSINIRQHNGVKLKFHESSFLARILATMLRENAFVEFQLHWVSCRTKDVVSKPVQWAL